MLSLPPQICRYGQTFTNKAFSPVFHVSPVGKIPLESLQKAEAKGAPNVDGSDISPETCKKGGKIEPEEVCKEGAKKETEGAGRKKLKGGVEGESIKGKKR